MSPVVLAALLAVLLLYLVARRNTPAPAAALADTAALEWMTAPDHPLLAARASRLARGWQVVTVPDLAAAEDLLDALEAAGYEEVEVFLVRPPGFRVRWWSG